MEDFRLIPFDLKRAKTPENPNGLEVVTGRGNDVRIICTDKISNEYPIVGLLRPDSDSLESVRTYKENGIALVYTSEDDHLYLKGPVTQRRMTNRELSWWLREHPEEHREFIYFLEEDNDKEHRSVHSVFDYISGRSNEPVDSILIRSNGGEWHEPFIEEEDYEL